MDSKPPLSHWQVLCVCVGAFGIQFGFALPQANATRIFQNLGATLDSVPLYWLAGPITGLLVQPLVGYYSDRTWTRFGRRRPYFLAGALLAATALVGMPNATALWMSVLTFWLLDASLNLTMGPYRAFVADQMPAAQRSTGYLMYMFFASVGAVIGSLLPWLFTLTGAAVTVPGGGISTAVKLAFGVGAVLLLLAVLWSALTTREYSPDMLERFDGAAPEASVAKSPERMRQHGWVALVVGALGFLACHLLHARLALHVLVFACLAYGLFLLMVSGMRRENAFTTIIGEMDSMSASVRWLALVQFFSWFSLFAMFMYAAPAVATLHFGSDSAGSPEYEAGANWTGVLFATYNGVGALAALVVPRMVRRLGIRMTHRINLWIGAAGLLSMLLIRDPHWLLGSMVGVGFAWASIISLPYAMLANNLPSRKMGVNIGIFNIFIVIPQLLTIGVMSWLLDAFAAGDASFALAIAAAGWLLAGWAVLRVHDSAP